jgi:phosphoglycerate dehydrogenase-like enzyme
MLGSPTREEPMSTYTLLLCTYLEPAHVEQLRRVSPRLRVIYEPELVPTARYPGDHYNTIERTPEQEEHWRELLAQADILFDFDPVNREALPELAPRVRWVQASSAGIGQLVRRWRYAERMPAAVFTTASGVHAVPLGEFCAMAMLAFSRNMLTAIEQQRRRSWERYAGTDLAGRTLGIVGVGKIGAEVARLGRALRMHVIGVKRTIAGVDAAALHLHALYPPEQLHEVLRQSEYLVLAAPHTDSTEGMIGAVELAALPRGAVLINIGRGAVVDEAALVAALRSGQLGGAALDVFETEPLPESSPLWDLPNVLICPHSASTSDRENARLTDLFCENLRRFLDGRPLVNVLDVRALY